MRVRPVLVLRLCALKRVYSLLFDWDWIADVQISWRGVREHLLADHQQINRAVLRVCVCVCVCVCVLVPIPLPVAFQQVSSIRMSHTRVSCESHSLDAQSTFTLPKFGIQKSKCSYLPRTCVALSRMLHICSRIWSEIVKSEIVKCLIRVLQCAYLNVQCCVIVGSNEFIISSRCGFINSSAGTTSASALHRKRVVQYSASVNSASLYSASLNSANLHSALLHTPRV